MILEAQHVMYVDPQPKNHNIGLSPPQALAPVSIGVTEHHFVVLRPGQVQMLSNVSGKVCVEIEYDVNTIGALVG